MTYIVNDNCIKCKLMDCVEVCPVDRKDKFKHFSEKPGKGD